MDNKTIVATFADQTKAEKAVNDLRSHGFDKEISILAKKDQNTAKGAADRTDFEAGADIGDVGGGLGSGITTGGALGGLAGLAVGAGALAIPGLGPLIAAGPIAGALSGAASGGIAGALVDWGIPEQEGRQYESDIRQGKILVSVQADEKKASEARDILKKYGADRVKEH